MISALLMFLLLMKAQSASSFPSCTASCLVCSEEAVICHRLSSIIEAPQSTQALLLNEGSISTVRPEDLTDLGNISFISLSHNRISTLDRRSFRNMPFLQSLLLDHNLLTLQALEGGASGGGASGGGALTNLTQLRVLALGNNRIDRINPGIFQGTTSLRILRLEGNQISRLESGVFPLNGLRDLERLDLSDNFIDYLDKNSFRGLISLVTLDLSRNRLQSAPAQAFSFLTWLQDLNLDLNLWNCSCSLLELKDFLSEFMQEPDQTLHNGLRMECVSADNPTVSTVLQLTDKNCVPTNQNVSLRVETGGSISSQTYVRDLAITGAVCFLGGVGLTLLIVLIYKVTKKKKQRQQQNQEEVKEEESTTVSNHVRTRTDTAERRRNFIGNNGPVDAQDHPRTVANGGHYRCPDCRGEEPAPNPVRWERMNGRVETLEDKERQRIRAEDDMRRIGPQQRFMGREAMNRHVAGNNINPEGQNRPELHCGSCHRTYRPNPVDHNLRQARLPPRENSPMHGLQQQKPNDWGRNSVFGDFDLRNLKRETRNVTFAMESPRRSRGVDGESEEEATSPRGRQDRRNKPQSGRTIKVKLNLNPLRKSKVHPKKKGDEKGSPKKSKEKSEGRKSKKGEKQKKSSEQETVAQVVPPNPMAQMQGFLGAQFRGGGMLLGNRAPNLLGASGPRFPFQGGNFPAQGNPMFPPPNPMAPNMNLGGPSMGPGGIPTMGLMASPNSSLANVQGKQASVSSAPFQASPVNPTSSPANRIQANVGTLQPNVNPPVSQGNPVVQASSTSTKPVSPSMPAKSGTAKQTTSLSANSSSLSLQDLAALAPPPSSSAAQSDSKLSPKSSPRGQAKTVQEPVPQSNNKAKSVTSEPPASPRKASQASIVAETVTPQASAARTMVKNMSSTSLIESIRGEAKELPTEEVEVEALGGADVSVSSVSGPTETLENNMSSSSALIQQEYLSEDGRKLRLVIPEKATNRPQTALERKLR